MAKQNPAIPRPIYLQEMPGTAWQLLWWMICVMDANAELRGGWRVAASRALKREKTWIGRCAEHLSARNLIETAPGKRWAKVITKNITG